MGGIGDRGMSLLRSLAVKGECSAVIGGDAGLRNLFSFFEKIKRVVHL